MYYVKRPISLKDYYGAHRIIKGGCGWVKAILLIGSGGVAKHITDIEYYSFRYILKREQVNASLYG